MLARIKKAALRTEGVTTVEYGLIVGAIAIAIIGGIFLIGSDIAGLFTHAGSAIGTASK